MKVLVLAEHFPNVIQTWLLNWLEAAMLGGWEVEVIAGARLGERVPDRVRTLGLDRLVKYFPLDSRAARIAAIRRMTSRDNDAAIAPLSRLAATLRAVASNQYSWRERLKAVLRSPGMSQRPTLIHSHTISMADDYRFLADAWQVPLVTTFHGLPPVGVPLPTPRSCRQVFARTSLFFVNTQFARRQLEGLGCPAEKIRILPQGTRLDDFPFSPSEFPVNGPIIVVTVARLHRDKGQEYAIDAIAELVRRGFSIEYRIVGPGPDRARLEEQVARLGLQRVVSFLGEVSEVELRRHYAEAHVFLLPSVRSDDGYHEETQGVVLQEAQASGLLVVTTRTGGIPECVVDNQNGFLVADRNAKEIADKIEYLATHRDRWLQWQTDARRHVADHFDTKQLGPRMLEQYVRAASGLPPLDDAPLR